MTDHPQPPVERGVAAAGPAPLTARQVRMYRGGFLAFLFSETFFFVTLFGIRFLMAGTVRPAELNLLLGAVITSVFAASAVTAWLALGAIRADDGGGLTTNAAATAVLGVAAAGLIVMSAVSSPIVSDPRFAEIFDATTWIHLAHIVIGLVFLAAIWSSGRRARFSAANHWMVEAGVRFWWFVSVTWLALYLIYYWI